MADEGAGDSGPPRPVKEEGAGDSCITALLIDTVTEGIGTSLLVTDVVPVVTGITYSIAVLVTGGSVTSRSGTDVVSRAMTKADKVFVING